MTASPFCIATCLFQKCVLRFWWHSHGKEQKGRGRSHIIVCCSPVLNIPESRGMCADFDLCFRLLMFMSRRECFGCACGLISFPSGCMMCSTWGWLKGIYLGVPLCYVYTVYNVPRHPFLLQPAIHPIFRHDRSWRIVAPLQSVPFGSFLCLPFLLCAPFLFLHGSLCVMPGPLLVLVRITVLRGLAWLPGDLCFSPLVFGALKRMGDFVLIRAINCEPDLVWPVHHCLWELIIMKPHCTTVATCAYGDCSTVLLDMGYQLS